MKYFVFGDVHGFYSLLMNELKESGFDKDNPDHMLISLGDNFDRGRENYQMFTFLKEMVALNKIILIKGNHEDLILKLIERTYPLAHDVSNGTLNTLGEFLEQYFGNRASDVYNDNFQLLRMRLNEDGFLSLINSMKDYYETDKYIFTHGYIPIFDNDNEKQYYPNWRKASKEQFELARWTNGMKVADEFEIYEEDKMIVIGHYHCSYGNIRKKYGDTLTKEERRKLEVSDFSLFNTYYGEHVICIDACTVMTHKINILIIEQ